MEERNKPIYTTTKEQRHARRRVEVKRLITKGHTRSVAIKLAKAAVK